MTCPFPRSGWVEPTRPPHCHRHFFLMRLIAVFPVDHRVDITVIVPTTLTICHSDTGSGAKAVTQCHHQPLNLARRSPHRENAIESWSPRARYCRHDNLRQSRMRRWRITSLSVHGHRFTDATPREGGRRGAAKPPRRQARKAATRRRRKGACTETSASVAATSDSEIAQSLHLGGIPSRLANVAPPPHAQVRCRGG